MSAARRVFNVILGILTILIAILMQLDPEDGYVFMLFFMGIGLTVSGLKELGYYLIMAKHMVDGKLVLYNGIVRFNFGLMTLTLSNIPQHYAMIYLLICVYFSAAVSFISGEEARMLGASLWKRRYALGIVQVVIATIGLLNLGSIRVVIMIYGFGLVTSALGRISMAFRKTEMVYVQ